MHPAVSNLNGHESLKAHSEDCVGVVLAGGQSKRMGTDKALLTDKQAKTCLQNTLDRLVAIGLKKIVISGDRHRDSFSASSDVDIRVVSDLTSDSGPLAALDSVLQQLVVQQQIPKQLLIIPVDMPYLKADYLIRLLQTDASVSCCFKDFLLPLKLTLNEHSWQAIKHCLSESNSRKHSIKNLYYQIPHSQLPLTAAEHYFFQNTNTPEQWQQFLNSKSSLISHAQEEPFKNVS